MLGGVDSVSSGGEDSQSTGDPSSSSNDKTENTATRSKVETFNDDCEGISLETHVRQHDFPAHVSECGPCRFWKHRFNWSARTTFQNELTGADQTGLGYRDGHGLCLVCSANVGYERDVFAQGQGDLRRLDAILRHGNNTSSQKRLLQRPGVTKGSMTQEERRLINWTHIDAVQAWNERARTQSLKRDGVTFVQGQPNINNPTEVSTQNRCTHWGANLLFARVLLETRGSFRDFKTWVLASMAVAPRGNAPATLAIGAAQNNNLVLEDCKQSVRAIGDYEHLVTHRLLSVASVFHLQADGRVRVYQVVIGAVIWKFPSGLSWLQEPHKGYYPWLKSLGPRGPWVIERLTGARELNDEMDCEGKVAMLAECVRRAATAK